MYLRVMPDGSRWWRLDYVHPDISLKAARGRREEARELVAAGVDPSEKCKVEKNAPENSFKAVAREWFNKFRSQWVESHSDKIIRRLERDVFPWIGARDAGAIKPPELLTVLRRVEPCDLTAVMQSLASRDSYLASAGINGDKDIATGWTCFRRHAGEVEKPLAIRCELAAAAEWIQNVLAHVDTCSLNCSPCKLKCVATR